MALTMMLLTAATGKAMSYEQARNEALFLTDKMAYELNLTDEQYEAAYEINLDYLMGVTSYDDVFGTYWERRNLDLSYILLDWQWQSFCAATYFYRPLYWEAGYWHFGIYARYPHRDYFFFGRPVFYASYRGGHAWHIVGGHGYYYGRRDHFRPAVGRSHFGMLDRWNRGDYRHYHNGRTYRNFGGNRNSSTRTTVGNGRSFGHSGGGSFGHNSSGSFGNGNRGNGISNGMGNGNSGMGNGSNGRTFGTRPSQSSYSRSSDMRSLPERSSYNRSSYNRSNTYATPRSSSAASSYSRANSTSSYSRSSGSFSRANSGSFNRSSGSFGGSSVRSSGSFGGSSVRSGGSFTRGGGSFGGGHGGGGGHSASGGRSFGGHR